ncbi:MAG TPA: HAD family hydrolase [Solirubrobacteraceae bacterium]|nr:HAD family hydrolase [Solirubrobacteraceae bacterium]
MLLLFDIDGTLLQSASGTHAEALHEALRRVHGVDSRGMWKSISPAGRTDGEIARLILLDCGVSAERIDARADRVREECCRAYARMVEEDLRSHVVPGMPSVLEWLAGLDGVRLSLVTGNYEAVARLKLRRAGIGAFFPSGQGGFGSDHEDRVALPPLARRRAGSRGMPYPREQTIVIGDTPRDIACARADGLRCVAVTTGPYGADELVQADAVAENTGELRAALESELAAVARET